MNNEALAKVIETTVGVVVRKATEKVAWCIYACTAKAGKTVVTGRSFDETDS